MTALMKGKLKGAYLAEEKEFYKEYMMADMLE
jgi:hypothetical protein